MKIILSQIRILNIAIFTEISKVEDKRSKNAVNNQKFATMKRSIKNILTEIRDKGFKANISSEHFKPQDNAETAQGSIELTPDSMEVLSPISSQNQRTAMNYTSTESYSNGQELTDIISTNTTEDNILESLSGKNGFHKRDENHLIDIPDDVVRTYEGKQFPNLVDTEIKSDTSVVNNDHAQLNETNDDTSKLLSELKEQLFGEKEVANGKSQDMSAMFSDRNDADTTSKHTESQSSFSSYQQLSGGQDERDIASTKLVDFSDNFEDDLNMMTESIIRLNVLKSNQAVGCERHEEVRGSFPHQISKNKLDPTEVIKNETNSEGQTDHSPEIENNKSSDERKGRICKVSSNGDEYDSHVNVPDPFIPIEKYCEILDEPSAINDWKTNKIKLDGEDDETSKKMQENGIVFESTQQALEEKDMKNTQKLHEMTHHSLENNGDYTGEKIRNNDSPDKTHIAISVRSEMVDILCPDYTEHIQEDTKEDPKHKVETKLNKMQTSAPTFEHIFVNSTAAAKNEDSDRTCLGVKNEKEKQGKKRMTLFPFTLRGKKVKHEVSSLFPDNDTGEVVLSKYTNTQTELSISLQGTQSKRRSMLTSFKKVNEQSMIDFGKRCKDCLSRPLENMNDEEIRCLNCFKFECLLCAIQCSCGNTCYCNMIAQTIEEKMERTKKILRESINERLPIEDTIYIVSTHCYSLHNGKTTLTLEMRLSKHYEVQNENKRENFIKVLVLDYEDPSSRKFLRSRQAVCVALKTVVDEKIIGLYSKDTTARQERFISPLIKYLGSRDIQVQKVDEFSGKLGKKDAQLIVVCLVHSRAMSDVNAALCEIEERFYKHIILVLLHFKQSDQRKCAPEVKSNIRFSEMDIIDLFQQPESDNIVDVYKKIIDAINSFK
ncbi:uncharacterized protein LOC132738411 [Ruditapes philippinarum]|uniref:uncharacterized protein LOC132738411 n=1 Tax=Ruditapes philippinarum TaxID=129788 RepID=UPI00295A9332|nr:uncharacterized protein LOC132738411 [Ruditapes philippinarum]